MSHLRPKETFQTLPKQDGGAPPPTPRVWAWIAYAIAILSTLATLQLRLSISSWLGERTFLILFALPIVVSAYIGGLGPGLLATALSACATAYLLLPPHQHFAISSPVDLAQWLVLIIVGVLASILSDSRQPSRPSLDTTGNSWQASKRMIQGGFAVAVASMGVVGLVSYFSIGQVHDETRTMLRTEQAVRELESFYAHITDAEAGRREFAISGDESSLQPFQAAAAKTERRMEVLLDLVSETALQADRLGLLRETTTEYFEQGEASINSRRAQGEAAYHVIALKNGRVALDQIRQLVSHLRTFEQEILTSKSRLTEERVRFTRTVIIFGGALAFSIVAVALYLMGRDFAGRALADANLREANQLLESRVRDRTMELEQANEAVRESITRLHTVTENARVGLVIVDEEHRYRYANRAYSAILNLPEQDLVGRSVANVLGSVYEDQIRPNLTRAFKGDRISYELRLPPLPPSTDQRYYAVSYEPGDDRTGKIVVVVIADISGIKLAEAKLRESFQETVDLKAALNKHAIVAITDPRGRITEVNDKFCEISKYTREELIGKDHRIINSGAHSKEFIRNLWKTIGQGGVWQGDIKNRAKDGSYYWVATTIVPFLDREGKPRQYVAIRADITARKHAEEARARLSGIVRSSSDAIIGKSLDGIITTWNSGAEKVFGYTEQEAIGQPMRMLFPPERLQEEQSILDRVRQDETVPHFDTQRLRKDGSLIDVSITISPVQDSEGRIIGASTIARDITEQRRAEAALRASEARLHAVTENLTEGLVISDIDGTLVHWNPASLAMHGFHNLEEGLRQLNELGETFELRTLADGILPLDEWPMARVLKGARLRSLKVRIRRKDFEWERVFSYTGEIVRDASGNPLAYLAVNDVTERLRAEEALRRSEGTLAATEVLSGVGSFDWDLQSNANWSQNMYRILDVDPTIENSGVLSFFMDQVLHPADRQEVTDAINAALAGTKPYDVGYRIIRRDGTEREIHARGEVVRDSDGRPTKMRGWIQDVTESKKAQTALRESETFNKEVLDSLTAHVAVLDREGRIVTVNEAWRHFASENNETLFSDRLGANYLAICDHAAQEQHDEIAAAVAEGIRKVMSGTSHYFGLEYPCHSTQEQRWFQLHVCPLTSRTSAVVTAHENITSRKLAEKLVERQRAELQLIFDSVPAVIFYKDPSGRLVRVNEELARLTGLPKQEIEGKTDAELGSPYAEQYLVEDREIMTTGRPLRKKLQPLHTLSGPRWVEIDKMPDRDENGVVNGIIGFALDVTERKEAEKAIRELNADLERRVIERTAQLEAANKELEAFSYSVSHDLRSPLRAIDGFSLALIEDYSPQLPEVAQDYLLTIRQGAQRMGVLIDDLLTFSRLSRSALRCRQIDTTALVRSALEDLSLQDRSRNTEINFTSLPSCWGDPSLLKQVWINLLSNAFKYSHKRSNAIIEIGAEEDAGETIFHVRDNGTGFDMRYAGKLFGVFQRLHRLEDYEGTGVGLAIVQRVIHRHGGRIWAEAEVDRGATFYFTLAKDDQT